MQNIGMSSKLDNVCYDIRGPVLKHAKRMEEEGHKILKLNIGNPAPFGFDAPDEILVDVIRNLPTSQGYCDSKASTLLVKPSFNTINVKHPFFRCRRRVYRQWRIRTDRYGNAGFAQQWR